jgi:hypothetical protein
MSRTGQPAGQVAYGQLGGGSNAYVDGQGIHVTDGTNVRVSVGDISAGGDGSSFGLKVVSQDGVTVIIDGTSLMFKVASSGTQSAGGAGGAEHVSDTTLTGLGTMSITPAHQSYVSDTSGNTGYKAGPTDLYGWDNAPVYVATSSGGSPTSKAMGILSVMRSNTFLNGSSYPVIELVFDAYGEGGSYTVYQKFYVLHEAAM